MGFSHPGNLSHGNKQIPKFYQNFERPFVGSETVKSLGGGAFKAGVSG